MKVKISNFVSELEAALNRKDGYIMGARGQNPQKWKINSWWFTQYKDRKKYTKTQEEKALYWREHAKRVWDCNGLAEGIYEDFAKVNINTKAKNNYAEWCDPKGKGMIPANRRVAGAAVFWGDRAVDIHHVAYLYKPVNANNPGGDWYIIEARGVMYGVVKTRLYDRKPNYWGWMTKYFDYDAQTAEPELSRGDSGSYVQQAQKLLIAKGYALPKYGADGDFGNETLNAVKAFQTAFGLVVDGVIGKDTWAALKGSGGVKTVLVTGGSVNVRSGAGTAFEVLFVAHKGDELPYVSTAANGWYKIERNGVECYISNKYSELK